MFCRAALLLLIPLTLFSTESIQLDPPRITPTTISEKIVSQRPLREECVRISKERLTTVDGTKTVVHCYGHCGSGWTMLFGSVKEAIDLFEEEEPVKSTPIHILGGGAIGLTMAIELSNRGYNVVGITATKFYDISSWRSAGIFSLAHLPYDEQGLESAKKLALESFFTYREIELGHHPYLSSLTVEYLPIYSSTDTDTGLDFLVEEGLIPPPEEISLNLGKVTHPHFLQRMTYFINSSEIMRELQSHIQTLGIPLHQKEIHSFEELPEKFIFNCTGLGSKSLAKDETVYSSLGHTCHLHNQPEENGFKYIIYTTVKQNGQSEILYFLPQTLFVNSKQTEGKTCQAILGGTYILYPEEIPLHERILMDRREFAKLQERSSLFFSGKSFLSQ